MTTTKLPPQLAALREKVSDGIDYANECGEDAADAAIIAVFEGLVEMPEYPREVTDELIKGDIWGPLAAQNDFKDGLRAFLRLMKGDIS